MSKDDEVVVPRDRLQEIIQVRAGLTGLSSPVERMDKMCEIVGELLAATQSPVPASGITVEHIDRIQSDVTKARNAGIHDDTLLALCALARRAVSAREPVAWIEYGIDSKPVLGQRIVCEYKTGEVWAGKYGGAKHSFLRWMPFPPTDSGSVAEKQGYLTDCDIEEDD